MIGTFGQAAITVAFGAIAGGVTNAVAIWMLFHPREPVRLFGRPRAWLHGAIPKNQARLARALGRTVATQLLTASDLERMLTEPEFRAAFEERLSAAIDDVLNQPRPSLRELLPPAAATEVESLLRATAAGAAERLDEWVEGEAFRERARGRARDLVEDEPMLAGIVLPLLRVRERLLEEAQALEARLVAEAKSDPVCRRLATVPGVGPITALAFRSGVDDIDRFPDRRQVGAWLGLVPRRYQSGKVDYSGKISRAGDTMLRALLFEAAHVLMSRVKRACALKSWAERLAKRVGTMKAKVAVARKLAVLLARLWAKDEEFRWQAA